MEGYIIVRNIWIKKYIYIIKREKIKINLFFEKDFIMLW